MVCDLLRVHGIPVFDADKEAKRLNDTSPRIREALTRHFGSDLYKGGKLDRQKLAALIFHDARNLAMVNSIIHPVLAEQFLEWCRERENYPFVAIDAAVLFEAGFEQHVDQVITVFSPEATRLERVTRRDRTDKSRVEARMQNQMPETEKIKRADRVIYNDNEHSLVQQVADILADYRVTY